MLDKFGVLPQPGSLYQQDPAFVDELVEYLNAVAAHERKVARDQKRQSGF